MKTLLVLLLVQAFLPADCMDNGLARTPPMGWLSWERYACQIDCVNFPNDCINEQLYMRTADLLVSEGYMDRGYEYVNIDDCWPAMARGPNNELVADPIRFPHGIQALADYVHGKGLKLGIYLDVGTLTCGGYPGFNITQDPRNTQYQRDVQLLASWGVDSLKADGCYADPAIMNVTYPLLSQALNATGRPILFSCSWPDYVRLRGLPIQYDLMDKYCNLWRNFDDISDSYQSLTGIIGYYKANSNPGDAMRAAAMPGAWNDPDMLMIGGTGLSTAQEEIQMAIWSIVAGPLLMSNDLSQVSNASKAILQNVEAIQVSQDPLGQAGYMISASGDLQVWYRPLANGDIAVALLNLGSFGPPQIVSFTASETHLPSTSFHVRDIFAGEDLGTFVNIFQAAVPSSSVRFLRASPVSGQAEKH